MAGDNPTIHSAEEDTGLAPLNAEPKGPQPPQHGPTVSDPTIDQVPSSLQDLPAPFQGFVLGLDSSDTRTKNKNSISSSDYPDSSMFEDLVKTGLKPEGPVRAEDVKVGDVKSPEGYADVVKLVKSEGEQGDLKVYKVVLGKNTAEIFAVSLDLDNDRLVGVKFSEP